MALQKVLSSRHNVIGNLELVQAGNYYDSYYTTHGVKFPDTADSSDTGDIASFLP